MRAFATIIAACLAAAGTAASAISYQALPAEAGWREKWSFDTGVAFISRNNIHDIALNQRLGIDDGPAGGEIYHFTASRLLGHLELDSAWIKFRPRLEWWQTLEVFDENGRDPFPDFNSVLVLRWTEFPWNEHLKTTFATGAGFSWSTRVPLMDIQRHSGQSRSRLQFQWPIQLTLALPEWPEHQLTLFLSHQSGGRIFDQGGMNALGIGYRREF